MVKNAGVNYGEPLFPERIKLPGLRVLLVSDEAYLAGAKLNIAREYGCECHAAGSVIDALWKLAENQYDLVAIDTGLTKDHIASVARYSETIPRIKKQLGITVDPKDPELIGGANVMRNGCRLGGLLVQHGVLTKYNLVFLTGGHSDDVVVQLGDFGLNGCDVLPVDANDLAVTLRDPLIMAFAFKSDGSLAPTQKPGAMSVHPTVLPGRKASPRGARSLPKPPSVRPQRTRNPR